MSVYLFARVHATDCVLDDILTSTSDDKNYFTKIDVLAHLLYSQMFWHFKLEPR